MKIFLFPDPPSWHTTYVSGVAHHSQGIQKHLQHSSMPGLLMHPGYATVYLMLFVHIEISEKLILSAEDGRQSKITLQA